MPASKQTVPVRKAKALKLIRKHGPVTPNDFKKLGLGLASIGAGVFREVARIKGCDLVVKFPLEEKGGYSYGIQHSISEMNRIARLSRVPELKPHLPKVFYFDRKNGIIVMNFYPDASDADKVDMLGSLVRKLVQRICRVTLGDIHAGNVRRKRKDWEIPLFVDLGY